MSEGGREGGRERERGTESRRGGGLQPASQVHVRARVRDDDQDNRYTHTSDSGAMDGAGVARVSLTSAGG